MAEVRRGEVWRGLTRLGELRQGLEVCRSASELVGSILARQSMVRWGWARSGAVRRGMARKFADQCKLVGSILAWSGQVWHGTALVGRW
jgi:hypothetical protein